MKVHQHAASAPKKRAAVRLVSRGGRDTPNLKHEITIHTNNGMTFEEIYELETDGHRVIAFQIPPATVATPTTWHGIPWSNRVSCRLRVEGIATPVRLLRSPATTR